MTSQQRRALCPECVCANGAPHYVTCSQFGQPLPMMAEHVESVDQPEKYKAMVRASLVADGYVFVKGCDSCPLETRSLPRLCQHPSAHDAIDPRACLELTGVPKDKAHPECPLRKHSLHIALEPTA